MRLIVTGHFLYRPRSQELLIATDVPECGCEKERRTAGDSNRTEKDGRKELPCALYRIVAKESEFL